MTKYSSPQLYGLEIGRGLWHISVRHPADPFLQACDTEDDIIRTEVRDDPPDPSAMCQACLHWMYVNEIGYDYDDIPRRRYLVSLTLSVEAVDVKDAVDKVRNGDPGLLKDVVCVYFWPVAKEQ